MTRLSRSPIALAAAALVAASLTLGVAGPALAATSTPRTLDELKADGAAAISQRQAQLTKLDGRLSAAPSCDADGQIAAEIAADGPALASLGDQLAADTTLPSARQHFQSIFADYRIYLVVTPQAYATAACGRIQRATATLTADQTKLDDRVQAAEAGGADMTAAKVALDDMSAKIADATTKGNQAASGLAAISPDHGDPAVIASNAAAVQAAHDQLEAAHTDLTTATQDARAVVADLKSA